MPAPATHPALACSDFPLQAAIPHLAAYLLLSGSPHLPPSPSCAADGWFTENSQTGPSPNVHKGKLGHRAATNTATLPKVYPPTPARAVEAEVCTREWQGVAVQEA